MIQITISKAAKICDRVLEKLHKTEKKNLLKSIINYKIILVFTGKHLSEGLEKIQLFYAQQRYYFFFFFVM